MTGATRGDRRRTIAIVASGVAVLLAALVWLDRGSLERGNRSFRAGDREVAIDLYGAARFADDASARYNLGTALLLEDTAVAEAALREASAAPDREVARRAAYNLAFARLLRITPDTPEEEALTELQRATEDGRLALALDPNDPDAKWNLALAQRMLDSLSYLTLDPRFRQQPGKDETPVDLEALTRSGEGMGESGLEPENPYAGESTGTRLAASQGAREAWTSQDPGPMSAAEALRLLASLQDQPERLVQGIMWSLRPEIAWWENQPYPGGDW